jgi:hypothetical protein
MLEIGVTPAQSCQGVSRRSFLQVGFLSALGLTLPEFLAMRQAQAAAAPGRSVILVWLWGGPSHLELFDPKPEAPSDIRGPFRAISTNVPGIQLNELLPRLAKQADRYALLRSLHHGSNDHGIAGTICLTGKEAVGGRVAPSWGSVVSKVRPLPPPLSPFIAVGAPLKQGHRPIQGEGGGLLGTAYDPFRVECDPEAGVRIRNLEPPKSVTAARLQRRKLFVRSLGEMQKGLLSPREAQAFEKFYAQAFSLMDSGKAAEVFDLRREPEKVRERYGLFRFGQSCLLARRLVEAGVPFVQVNWSSHVEAPEDAGDGGWDMHSRTFELMQDRHNPMLDRALSALLDDLHQRGLLESTLVVAMGEFGRSPKINTTAGREHWNQCYCALMAGAGVRGGQVIGESDCTGEYPATRPTSPADVAATIFDRLAIPRTELLAQGLAPEGEVIQELF